MTEVLTDILHTYLDCGYHDIQGFWDLTLPEIIELLKAGERKIQREQKLREAETKEQIIIMRNLALQTGESVACLFDKNKKTIRSLSEYYPGLFEEAQQASQEMDEEVYQALFEDYCYRRNEYRKRMRNGGDVNERISTVGDTEEAGSSADRQYGTAEECDDTGRTGDISGNNENSGWTG